MNRKRMFMIALLALVIAGFLTILASRAVRKATPTTGPLPAKVVVATHDLGIGAKVMEGDMRVVDSAVANVPAGAFSTPSEVIGRGVIVPIVRGEAVLSSKLAAEKAGAGLPSVIPPGMRAVSVRVNEVIAVAGFVVPGTRVDVLLTGSPGERSNPMSEVTTTVLENVEVLAAGQKLERDEAGKPQQVTVITLLASPQDAQKLTLAASGGHIQLVLRNPMDTEKHKPTAVSQAALYQLEAAPVVRTVKRVSAPVVPRREVTVVEVIKGQKRENAHF